MASLPASLRAVAAVAALGVRAGAGAKRRLVTAAAASSAPSGVAALHVERNDVRASFAACVGNTPLIRLKKLSEETGCNVRAVHARARA
jgi:hypothetical protein